MLAWWGPHQASARPGRLRLAGLDPHARYLEAGGGREHPGAALMQEGLALPAGAGSDFGSTLVRLSRL